MKTVKMGKSGNVRLTGTITIPLEEQDRFRPMFIEHAKLTRQEPGCLVFEVAQDILDPVFFRVSELFEDEAAFVFHQERTSAAVWGQQSGHLKRDFKKELL